MTDNSNTQSTANPPMPPSIVSGQELYDMIMGAIEPDLISTNVDTLAEKYATQSDAEREERSQRYRSAFAEYERRLQEYQRQWNDQLRIYKRHAISYIEHQSAADESSHLEEIDFSINA